tara:strand:- start:976 stop:1527 length:552 start_codon:yes stop_codon:yes gene_type:complete
MKEKEIECAFFMDNSILLNVNVNELDFDWDKVYYCIPDNSKKPYRWSASLHCAVVNLEFLSNFVSMCLEYYQDENKMSILREKYDYHTSKGQPGGICDMTLLYLYSKDNEVVNLLDYGFDHTITSDESSKSNYYIIKNDLKDYFVYDGKIKVKNFTEEYEVLHTLNFQGQGLRYFDDIYKQLI